MYDRPFCCIIFHKSCLSGELASRLLDLVYHEMESSVTIRFLGFYIQLLSLLVILFYPSSYRSGLREGVLPSNPSVKRSSSIPLLDPSRLKSELKSDLSPARPFFL